MAVARFIFLHGRAGEGKANVRQNLVVRLGEGWTSEVLLVAHERIISSPTKVGAR